MADRYQPWGQDQQDTRRRDEESTQERERNRGEWERDRGSQPAYGAQDHTTWQGGNYPGGGFGSEHRGYAHTREPQGAFGQAGGHTVQHATGYGSHGYGGQTSGPSMQTGYGSQAGYGAQGSNAYEGGPGFGLPGDYGGHRGSASPTGRSGEFGGYGPQAGGYGGQSSYASHGGYGSPDERWHTGYGTPGGFHSQGYGTHAGYGSQRGYGPQGDARWPQSSWAQQGRGLKRGPKGYKRSDERIREDICERLMHSDFIDSSDVTIEVNAGKVVMEGTVPERRMKHAIEDMAEATSGVNEVDNKVRVEEAESQSGWSGSSRLAGE